MRKKIFSIVLALCMALTLIPTMAFAADFPDTEGSWAEEQIERWTQAGVVHGDQNGNFNPDGNMTRAEAAQVFVNLLKISKTADLSVYTDIEEDAWYADALSKVVEAEIIKGMSASTIEPETSLSREMMFVMIARALGIAEEDTADKTFVDSDTVDDWAAGSINALVNLGVIQGYSATHMEPLKDIDRASVMAALDRLIGGYANEDGQTVEIVEGKVTLIVADDVKVKGAADSKVPIVVTGNATKLNMSGVTGAAKVYVETDTVTVTGAKPGTEFVTKNADGVTVNGHKMSENDNYTIPENRPSYIPPVEPEEPETYTVTLEYKYAKGEFKEEMGTVSTDPTSLEDLTAGTVITITVKPTLKYVVKSVVADDTSLERNTEGKYSYTVTDNVTIAITFEDKPSISLNGVDYYYDEDEKELVSEDGSEFLDPKEFSDLSEFFGEAEEGEFSVDGKEVTFDNGEWYIDGDEATKEEVENLVNGALTSDPVDGEDEAKNAGE